ncbi:MAG: hypothetical protein U0R64_07090 [Candidatus Nanopelagicales bacterium]
MPAVVARWVIAAVVAVAVLLPVVGNQSARAEPTATAPDPAQVTIGAYIDNIQMVSLETNSFDASISVWLRWTDPDLNPQDSLEITNLFQSWSLTTSSAYDEPVKQADGSYYYLVHYQGSFNTPFSVADYPFDSQTLQVVLQDTTADAGELQFVPDSEPAGIDPTVTLPGYDIGTPSLTTGDYTYSTNFGEWDPQPGSNVVSRVVVSVPLASPAVPGFVKTVLPILLVVATAFLVFFVPVELVEARVGLVITGLLTLVAMQLGLSGELPDVAYLLMLDVLYLCAYAFLLFAMADVIFTARRVRLGNTDGARTVNQRVMVVLALGYLAATAGTIVFYVAQ